MKSILRSPVKQLSAKYLKGKLTREVSRVIYLLEDSVDLYFNCMALPGYPDALSLLVTPRQELHIFLDVLKRDSDELLSQLRNISSVCSSSDYRRIYGNYQDLLQLLNSPAGVTDEQLYTLAACYYLLNRTSVKPFTSVGDSADFGNSFVFSSVHADEIAKASKLMNKTILVLSDGVIKFAYDYLRTSAASSDTTVVADGLLYSLNQLLYIYALEGLAKQVYVSLQLTPMILGYMSRLGIDDPSVTHPKALIRLAK
jgi:hypothetical protein